MNVQKLRPSLNGSGTTREVLSFYGTAGGALFVTAGALLAVAAHAEALTSRDYLKLALLLACVISAVAAFRGKGDKTAEILALCSAFAMGGALAAYAQTYPSSADSPAFFAGWAFLIFPALPYSKYVRTLMLTLLDVAVVLQLTESGEDAGLWLAVSVALWHAGVAAVSEAISRPAALKIGFVAQVIAVVASGAAMLAFAAGGYETFYPACAAAFVSALVLWHARYVRLRAPVLACGAAVGCVCVVVAVFRAFPPGAEVSALCVSGVAALAVLAPASSYLLRLHASSHANRKSLTS